MQYKMQFEKLVNYIYAIKNVLFPLCDRDVQKVRRLIFKSVINIPDCQSAQNIDSFRGEKRRKSPIQLPP